MRPPDYPVSLADGQPPLAWSSWRTATAEVVHLVGDLDLSTAPRLRRLLSDAATRDTAIDLVLDFTEVRFVDAHCVGVIEQAWATAKVRGRTLSVRGVHGLPARVFDILGLRSWLCRDDGPDGDGQPGGGGGGGNQATGGRGW